eukprot:NODE_321_length_11054_cov_0.461524.p1 type:complete len:965 gc:universal NODE_321_length_11054_cov_0.461524:755-3649(+)
MSDQDLVKDIKVSSIIMKRFEFVVSAKIAYREAARNKFNFLLGLLTVFIVVSIVAILVSVIDYAPLIFLGLSEQMQGQIDLYAMLLNEYASDMRFNLSNIPFNAAPRYTESVELFKASGCSGFNINDPFNSKLFYPDSSSCEATTISSCLIDLCDTYTTGNILAFDHDLESNYGIGSKYPFDKLLPNQIIIGNKLANELNIHVNDHVIIPQSVDYLYLQQVYSESLSKNISVGTSVGYASKVINIAQVVAVVDNPYRKTSLDSDAFIFMELSTLPSMQASQMHPNITDNFKQLFTGLESTVNQFIKELIIPCSLDRQSCYSGSSYDSIANTINPWASDIRTLLGYDEVVTSLPILVYLQDQRFFISMLNLLLSLVVVVLGSISVFLIYSLLMTSVETKIFETGIARMIGFRKINIYATLILQGLFYSIPGCCFGLLASQVAFIFVGQYLNDLLQVVLAVRISSRGILIAFLLGFFIPIFASIVPVKKALSYNIHDALDQRQSTFKPVKITIERTKSHSIPVYQIIGGCIAVSVGFSVYYLLPVALVNGDIVLMFNIFFIILVLMLVGLTVLGTNFESIIQNMLLDLIFIFPIEKKSMKQLIGRNLLAHKQRNKKTTLIFAVALSFIIFLTVSGNIQLDNLDFTKRRKAGTIYSIQQSRYYDDGQATGFDNYLEIEQFLLTRSEVLDIAYSTYPLVEWDAIQFKNTMISNLGQTIKYNTNIYATSPNFLDVMNIDFIEMYDTTDSHYSPIESLYGLKNGNTLIMGEGVFHKLYLDSLEDKFTITKTTQDQNGMFNSTNFIFNTQAVFSSFPFYSISKYSSSRSSVITDLFTMYHMAGWNYTGIENVPLKHIFIKTKELTSKQEYIFLRDLKLQFKASSSIEINNISGDLSTAQFAKKTLQTMFQCISAMIILLMFFSLNSSMSVNIQEQKKEIGILRSLGLTAVEIYRLYIFEATVLVLSAGFLG